MTHIGGGIALHADSPLRRGVVQLHSAVRIVDLLGESHKIDASDSPLCRRRECVDLMRYTIIIFRTKTLRQRVVERPTPNRLCSLERITDREERLGADL